MSLINFAGLASGLDTNAIVDALVGVQRIPIQRVQVKQNNIDVRISKVADLKSRLEELQTAVEKFQTEADILAYNGTSTNEDVVKVSTGAGALPGNFDVTVNSLARTEKNRSTGFTNPFAEVQEGTLSISSNGGTATDIPITAGMTLRQVADAINAEGLSVQASIVNNGTESFLQVSSKETGYTSASADDAVVITESYTGTTGQQLGLAQFQQASNAQIVVDQLTVDSTSNTISDAVEGVTFSLIGEGDSEISVASDRDATKENIQALVDAYNNVISFVQGELRVDEGENRSRSLASDPAVRQLKQRFSTFISGFVNGTGGAFNSLSQLGIKTDGTGKLGIDATELNDALDKDPFGVADVFLQPGTGIVAQIETLVDQYTDPVDGVLTERTKAMEAQNRRYDDQIIRMEDRIDQYRQRLVRQFTAMETAIAGFNAQSGQLAGLASLGNTNSSSGGLGG